MGGKTTSTQKADPQITAAALANLDSAKGLMGGYQPYTGELTAGQSPLTGSFFDTAQSLQGTGQGLLGSAAGAAQGVLGYQPMQVTAPTVGNYSAGKANTYDASQALGLLGGTQTAAGVDRGAVRDVNLAGFDGSQIKALMNPYETDVVRVAQDDFERQRLGALNADAATAARAGAFGNTGFGVQKALTSEGALRAADSATAGIRHAGWETAGNLALGARGQDLTAAQGNQNADLGVASKNADVSMFNTGQGNEALRTGAGLLGQAGIFNAGAANDVANADANRALTSGTANQSALLASLLANQDAGLKGAGLQLQGAGLLGDLGRSQSDMALGQAGLLGDAAGQQQKLSQDELDRQYAAYIQDLQNKLAIQQAQTGAVGALPQDSTTTQKKGFGLTDIANIGLSAASLFGSDERIKTDIETVRHDAKGRRWVNYRYVWDEPGVVRHGVIAQEVQKTDPEAVMQHPMGFLMVDYSKLED